MDTKTILFIIGFFTFSFILMIPFLVRQNKRKTKESEIINVNRDKAIIKIYGSQPKINGKNIKEYSYVKGEYLDYVVALPAGEHAISAKYSTTVSNKNLTCPKPIDTTVFLEAGGEYTISIYLYSPEERENYYEGKVGEVILSQCLDITGLSFKGFTNAYVICYKEKQDGEVVIASS